MSESDDKVLALLDQVLSLTELVGYVTPGGLVLAGAAALTSDLLRAFFGGDKAATVNAITALGDSLVETTRAVDRVVQADMQVQFIASYQAGYNAANKAQKELLALYLSGKPFDPQLEPAVAANWKTRQDEVKAQCEPGAVLSSMVTWLERRLTSRDRYQLTPLYLAAGVQLCNFCKLALLIEVAEMAMERLPDESKGPLHVDADRLTSSPYYHQLATRSRELLRVGAGLVESLAADMESRRAQVQARVDEFAVEQTGEGWVFRDAGSGFASHPDSEDNCRLAMEVARGKARTDLDGRLTAELGLHAVSQAQLSELTQLVDQIRKVTRTYSVPDAA